MRVLIYRTVLSCLLLAGLLGLGAMLSWPPVLKLLEQDFHILVLLGTNLLFLLFHGSIWVEKFLLIFMERSLEHMVEEQAENRVRHTVSTLLQARRNSMDKRRAHCDDGTDGEEHD